MQTPQEWYKNDQSVDILDPDGFGRDANAEIRWWYTLISKEDYVSKMNRCSIRAFNAIGHQPPYDKPRLEKLQKNIAELLHNIPNLHIAGLIQDGVLFPT